MSSFEYQAKIFDIPIPFGALLLKTNENSYSYTVDSKIEDLKLFYDTEMEVFGWDLIANFNNNECLLVFSKPGKKASISMRVKNNKVNVLIFLA